MEEKIRHIILQDLKEEIKSIKEIIGFGQVNKVYEIIGKRKEYVIRTNEDANKEIEYKKEKWCIREMKKLGIRVPTIIKVGNDFGINYMIQEKLIGLNGKLSTRKEKLEIWYRLGVYAKTYHKVNRIKVAEVEKNEFHANWEARLDFNIKKLNQEDSLLKNKILTKKEQKKAIEKLEELKGKGLREGLVHGDLSPRNVIMSKEKIYLLDWGTAEINVTPHNEIGLVLLSKEANKKEFDFFLEGLKISKSKYKKIEAEILKLNLLHTLDKYRWAESYDLENIKDYGKKIKLSFKKVA